MCKLDDTLIPSSQLQDDGDGGYVIESTAEMPVSVLSALLLQSISDHSSTLIEDDERIDLVSNTLDVTGGVEGGGLVTFTPKLDRKTRTVIFTGGQATVEGEVMLTSTVVFRISKA